MLIRYYGTHYVRYAHLASSVKMKNVVTQSYVERPSCVSAIAVSAPPRRTGATVGASHSNSESSSDSSFPELAEATTQIGGNPAIKACRQRQWALQCICRLG